MIDNTIAFAQAIHGLNEIMKRDPVADALEAVTRATEGSYAALMRSGDAMRDLVANYDGSTEEPKQLPARLPFVLLNGASGIAVGLATEVPSHNLREVAAATVALIRNDKLTDDALFELVPGPDYPGGGQIISSNDDIRAAYAGGRGTLRVRAQWKIEDLARGQWQLAQKLRVRPQVDAQRLASLAVVVAASDLDQATAAVPPAVALAVVAQAVAVDALREALRVPRDGDRLLQRGEARGPHLREALGAVVQALDELLQPAGLVQHLAHEIVDLPKANREGLGLDVPREQRRPARRGGDTQSAALRRPGRAGSRSLGIGRPLRRVD